MSLLCQILRRCGNLAIVPNGNTAPIFCEATRSYSGNPGDGEGKGGGAGGSIRSSGGPFAKREVAEEEKHFREEQARQLAQLKEQLKQSREEKIIYHQKQIQRHQECITEYENLKKSEKDQTMSNVAIKGHKESVKAHQDMLDSLKKTQV